MIKPTISFYTLGCRLNHSETTVLERSFEAHGYTIVDFEKPADVVIINTCTVTENGDADTRYVVNKINRLNPHARIALIGCQAQMQKERLAQFPNVRWVVGNARKMDLAGIMGEDSPADGVQVIVPPIPRGSFTVPLAGIDRRRARANLKIQDGCDFFCSFCEIPYARGRARSRQFDDILSEARALVAAGHKELVLTGINVGTYQYKGYALTDVITALEDIAGLARIRISSIEPTTISLTLLKKMVDGGKLCRYLHVPLQSASNDILKKMKRKYSAQEFKEFLGTACAMVPCIGIGTDLIVGFPGETEADFQESLRALRDWPIHYAHVFSYSQRTMAQSRHFVNKVPPEVIQERSQILRDTSQRKRRLFMQALVGTRVFVLVEQNKDGYWQGLTDHYVRVHIASNRFLANELTQVHIEAIEDAAAVGRI